MGVEWRLGGLERERGSRREMKWLFGDKEVRNSTDECPTMKEVFL